jgi:hypothetical protein
MSRPVYVQGPAGRLTDQVDEFFDHPVFVGPGELLVDTGRPSFGDPQQRGQLP